MLAQRTVITGAYVQDILSQPEALRRTLASFNQSEGLRELAGALRDGYYRRIVLTGMGSSHHAQYALHLRLTHAGYPSLLVETSELVHYLPGILDESTLLVAVSQSGQSAEVVRLVDIVKGRVPLIAITNNPESYLARHATAHLPIHAGVEASVSCKTYVASLLALEWLGAILCGDVLSATRARLVQSIPAVEAYLANWREHVEQLRDVVCDVRQVFVTGRSSSLTTALTGGLILKESTRYPAEGMSCAAFRHGPFETLDRHVLVVVLAGDSRTADLNRRLAADVERAGGIAALVEPTAAAQALRIPEVAGSIRPVLEILPVQMLSLALAACSGREAGRFERASKITATE